MRTLIPFGMACALLWCCSSDPRTQEKDLADQVDGVAGETTETVLPTSCEGMEGEPCSDGDPCHPGAGVCVAGECVYEGETTQCDEPPDGCSANGRCNPEGGCFWDLADGWCRIEGECVAGGESAPSDPCWACVPDVDRGGWSPVSGPSCEPPENPCTDQGKCEQGFCLAVAGATECAADSDCVKKDDGDRCNGIYRCQSCECAFDESSVVTCPEEGNTACAQSTCNPNTGKCSMQVAENGSECDDGDPCTNGDVCVGGECQSGSTEPPTWEKGGKSDLAYLTSVRVIGGTPPALYAVGAGGVVYSSQDMGQSFQSSDLLADGGVPGDWLFVSGGTPRSILAIFGNALFVSTDSGLSYEKKLTGCMALAQASASTAEMPTYVAACQGALYASQDKGATWAFLPGSHLPNGAQVTGFSCKDTQLVFIGTRGEDAAGRGYLYRTQDGGSSWSQVDPPDRPNQAYVSHRGLLMTPQSPDRLFVGYSNIQSKPFEGGTFALFRSEDGGSSFMALNPNFSGGGAAYVPLALDSIGRLILGVDSHLSRGGSFGTGPWGQIPDPTPPGTILLHSVHSVAVHPVNDFTFFVPAYEGLAMASDLGAKWGLLNKGLDGVQLAVMARCGDGKTIYGQDRLSRAVVRSVDGGATFARLAGPPEAAGKEYAAAACSPTNAAAAWFFGAGGAVLSTKNGGQLFTLADEKTGLVLGGPQRLGLSGASPGQLFLARQGLGLFRSEDGANPAGSGFKATGPAEAYISSVLADPFEQGRVYVGTRAVPPKNEARLYTCSDLGGNCSLKMTVQVDQAGAGQAGFDLFADTGFPGRG
ncbi:MAG: exo-alpha-sialidase, partial [Deltaproteobacteria bacterium]|nr:exo-alpha-sialidase [Deltaproteobacteria bacterium]